MKKYLAFVLALICGLTGIGCSFETEGSDGGFIRETYSGTIEEQPAESGREYLRVDIGNNEVIDFLLTDSSEIAEDAAISTGDAVEIDCVLWYATNTYEVLKLTKIDGVVAFHGQLIDRSALSEETLEWLEQYNSLPAEEQLAVSFIPSDLLDASGISNGKDTEAATDEWNQTENQDLAPIDPDRLSQNIYDALRYEWETWEKLSPEQKMLSSHLPGYCRDDFSDWEECEKFFGISIWNPLEESTWLEKGTYTGMPEGFRDAAPVEAGWYGTQDGQVEWISIQSGYHDEEIRATLNAMMYGSLAEEKRDDGGWSVELERQFYFQNQKDGMLLITEDGGEQFTSCTAYFVEDNVLYRVSVTGEPDMRDEVQETLERVLADFDRG